MVSMCNILLTWHTGSILYVEIHGLITIENNQMSELIKWWKLGSILCFFLYFSLKFMPMCIKCIGDKEQTCQSWSSVATFNCSNLVSRYNCKLSGAERSGRSLWSRYLLWFARWFLMISQSLLNSVVRLYCLQNWKARCAVICMNE